MSNMHVESNLHEIACERTSCMCFLHVKFSVYKLWIHALTASLKHRLDCAQRISILIPSTREAKGHYCTCSHRPLHFASNRYTQRNVPILQTLHHLDHRTFWGHLWTRFHSHRQCCQPTLVDLGLQWALQALCCQVNEQACFPLLSQPWNPASSVPIWHVSNSKRL